MEHIKPMKKLWLAALLVLLFTTIFCFAVSAETEGIYTYTVTNDEATITDCDTSTSGALTIPSTLGGYPVTGIGWGAFTDCSSLTSITIPESVTSIGNWAFSNCDSLTSITILEGATSIGYYAFSGCSSLTSVTIPESVTSIGNDAFRDCSSLTSVTIPESVTSISMQMFCGCSSLTSVTIPESVTSIDWSAFMHCSSLTSVTIPESVTSISAQMFCDCSSLTSVTIPESVTSIGWGAFSGCSSLTSVTIPDGVTNIDSGAFQKCSSLTSVTILSKTVEIYDESNTIWRAATIYGYSGSTAEAYATKYGRTFVALEEPKEFLYSGTCGADGDNLTWGLTAEGELVISGEGAMADYTSPSASSPAPWCSYRSSIHKVTIGDGVTSIGNDAFNECSNLTSVRIPNSVTSIGKRAFAWCTSLPSVTLPNGVTIIDSYAFAWCFSLTSVVIPDNVTSIGTYAFYLCDSLTSVTIGSSVTSIGNDAFRECFTLVEVINKSSLNITKGSYDNGDVAEYALEVHNGESKIVNQNNYLFYTYEGVNYLLGYAGTETVLVLPESYNSQNYEIYSYAFLRCDTLTSVTIPDSVTSIGHMAFDICTSLTSVTIGNSVTSIGYGAFSNCTSLTSVTIPDSVTTILEEAFSVCTSLTSVTIPESVTAIGAGVFRNCESLVTITVDVNNSVYHSAGNCIIETESKTLIAGCKNSIIPTDGSVTSIGDWAFSGCSSLTSITIPDSVTSIGNDAFYYCTSLTSVTFLSETTSIYDSEYTIDDGATIYGYAGSTAEAYATKYGRTFVALEEPKEFLYSGTCGAAGDSLTWGLTAEGELVISGEGAMADYSSGSDVPWYTYRSSIKTVTIGDSVTSIGEYAFQACTNLTSVNIPDSVTSIGGGAFSVCSSLTSITIPERVTSIGWYVFTDCKSLTSVSIPEGVTSIGDGAFWNCTTLTSVKIPESVTSIGLEAFSNCSSLASIAIPGSVTSIGYYAFGGCTSLSSLYISDITTWCAISFGGEISNPMWYAENVYLNGEPITELVIPKGVTTIGGQAFQGFGSLTSVTIPDSVTSIGHEAFSYCSSLTSATILSKTATIYDSSTTIDDGATIYGYAGSTAEAYATKYGRTFVALDETEALLDGSLVGFQVTKGENGAFSLRAIAGLNSLKYKNFGYEVTITIKDEDGNCAVKPLSGMDDKAYSSIYGGNTAYSIKETFGYEYAGLATITNLAVDSIYTKLEIRPFVTTMDGEKQYGKSGTFLYTGELDEDGYPSLSFIADTECEHSVPDDMECCEGYTCSLCGAVVEHSHEYDESSIRVSNVLVTTDPEQDIVAVLLQLQCAKSCCTEPTTVTVMETGNVFLYDDVDGNEVLSANDTISFDYELDGVVYSIVAIRGDGYWTEEVSAR